MDTPEKSSLTGANRLNFHRIDAAERPSPHHYAPVTALTQWKLAAFLPSPHGV